MNGARNTWRLLAVMLLASIGVTAASLAPAPSASAYYIDCENVGCVNVGGSRTGTHSFTVWVQATSFKPYTKVTLQYMVYEKLTMNLIWSDTAVKTTDGSGRTGKLSTWVDCYSGAVEVHGWAWRTGAVGLGQPGPADKTVW